MLSSRVLKHTYTLSEGLSLRLDKRRMNYLNSSLRIYCGYIGGGGEICVSTLEKLYHYKKSGTIAAAQLTHVLNSALAIRDAKKEMNFDLSNAKTKELYFSS